MQALAEHRKIVHQIQHGCGEFCLSISYTVTTVRRTLVVERFRSKKKLLDVQRQTQ